MFEPRPGKLIVSCQPSSPSSPLNAPDMMAAVALAAARGGATALRVNSPEHVRAVKAVTALPVIGLWKRERMEGHRFITPDFESAAPLVAAGACVIALEATCEAYRSQEALAGLITRIHRELGVPVLADVATLDEGLRAARCGADAVATTLSGYTADTLAGAGPGPDMALVRALAAATTVPVVAEGRYASPAEARAALAAGAAYVVVGGALTAPDLATARWVREMEPPPGPPSAERVWAEAAVALAAVQATQAGAVRAAAAAAAAAVRRGAAVRWELRGGALVALAGDAGEERIAELVLPDGPSGHVLAVTEVLIRQALQAELDRLGAGELPGSGCVV